MRLWSKSNLPKMAVGGGGGGGELANDGAPGKVRRCKGVKQASEVLFFRLTMRFCFALGKEDGNATTRTSGGIGRGFPRYGAASVSARLSTGLHG